MVSCSLDWALHVLWGFTYLYAHVLVHTHRINKFKKKASLRSSSESCGHPHAPVLPQHLGSGMSGWGNKLVIFLVHEYKEPPCPPPGLCLHLLLCSGSEANLDLIWGHWRENRSLAADLGLGFPPSYLLSEICPRQCWPYSRQWGAGWSWTCFITELGCQSCDIWMLSNLFLLCVTDMLLARFALWWWFFFFIVSKCFTAHS